MAQCPKCGNKIGLFSKVRTCEICQAQFCDKCNEWRVTEHIDMPVNREVGGTEKDHFVCSENCTLKIYENFVSRITPDVTLMDCSHIGFEITENNNKKVSSLYIDNVTYWKTNVQGKYNRPELTTLIPVLVPLYSRIKSDLTTRKVKFVEDYMDVI